MSPKVAMAALVGLLFLAYVTMGLLSDEVAAALAIPAAGAIAVGLAIGRRHGT